MFSKLDVNKIDLTGAFGYGILYHMLFLRPERYLTSREQALKNKVPKKGLK